MGRLPLRKQRSGRARAAAHCPSNGILHSIPDGELRILQPKLEHCNLRQHQVLYEPGREIEFLYFVEHGLVSLLVTTEDGKAVSAGMVGNEGVAGVSTAVGVLFSPLRQLVQIPGDGHRIPVARLREVLKQTPQLQMELSRFGVVQGMLVAQTAACNRLHEIEQRLSRWLLMATDRIGASTLPLTHDFLALTLGTHRPSVSLAARMLQKKNVIQYRRGAIEIVNRKKLEASACECYTVIRQFNRVLHL